MNPRRRVRRGAGARSLIHVIRALSGGAPARVAAGDLLRPASQAGVIAAVTRLPIVAFRPAAVIGHISVPRSVTMTGRAERHSRSPGTRGALDG